MIPVLYLNEAPKPVSVYRDSVQLGGYDWRNIGIKSLTSINKNETSSSWKRRKIDLERFRI